MTVRSPAPARRTAPFAGGVTIAVALATTVLAAPATGAIPNDAPGGALPFESVTAENGTVAARQRVVTFEGAGPDAAPRCLGPHSFQRTAWLLVPAAEATRRIRVEAAPRDASTAVPDLAAYVQPDGRRGWTGEPTTCAGRETAGDGSRGDEAAAVTAVVAPRRAVLIQVGWRAGDGSEPVVATLATDVVPTLAAPRGAELAGPPKLRVGRPSAVALRGATLASGDPAQPACLSQAAVWRQVRLRRKGHYALAAAGDATTLTAFKSRPTGDGALACASDADGPLVGTTVRTRRNRVVWLRVGVDAPESASPAAVLVRGPFASARKARKALPATRSRAARIFRKATR